MTHDPQDKTLTGTQMAEIEDFSERLDEIVPDQFWSDVKPPDGLSDDEQECWDMMWDAATILRTQGYSPTLLRDFFDTVVTAILVWESEN